MFLKTSEQVEGAATKKKEKKEDWIKDHFNKIEKLQYKYNNVCYKGV